MQNGHVAGGGRLVATVASAVLLIGLVLAAGCATGGGGAGLGGQAGRMARPQGPSVSEIIVRLNLTGAQRSVVREILESEDARRAELTQGTSSGGRPDPSVFESMRAEVEALREETDAQLSAVLTNEQMGTYREIVEEHRAEMENMREQGRGLGAKGGGGGGGRGPGW
jgi:hypothetical protein